MADDRARYWGALNQWRASTVPMYAGYVALQQRSAAQPWVWPRVIIGAPALALVTWTAVWVVPDIPEHPLALVPAALFFGIGAVLGSVTVRLHYSIRRRDRAHAQFRAAQGERARWHDVLAGLAQRCDGVLEAGGTEPAVRYLAQWWPDAAPCSMLCPFQSEEDRRLTVTGTCRGYPMLVQVADFWPARAVRPPLLFLLIARALQPGDPAPAGAGQRLRAAGLSVGVNRAGVWAVHDGPASALLSDADELLRVAEDLAEACARLPAAEPVPRAGFRAYPDSAAELGTQFLAALAARDAISVIGCAAPQMFAGQPMEPSPADIDRALDTAQAQPIRWERLRQTREVRAGGRHAEFGSDAWFAGGRSGPVSLYLTQSGSRWVVAGYRAFGKPVLGEDFPYFP